MPIAGSILGRARISAKSHDGPVFLAVGGAARRHRRDSAGRHGTGKNPHGPSA